MANGTVATQTQLAMIYGLKSPPLKPPTQVPNLSTKSSRVAYHIEALHSSGIVWSCRFAHFEGGTIPFETLIELRASSLASY